MNQNLLNYFQAKQQEQMLSNQPSQVEQPPFEYAQNMQPQPQMQMQMKYPAEAYNPFDQGIKRAVEAARSSFSPTAEQSDRALRGGLLAFGDSIRNSPKERGFAANASALGGALSPALASYDNSSAAFEAQNHALASQIVDYNKYLQSLAQKEEENAWNRDFKERELEERKQNHLFHNFMRNAKNNGSSRNLDANGEEVDPNFAYIQGQPFRKLDKIGMRHALTDKRETAKANHEIQELYKSWNKLEDKTKDNTFAPVGGWSGITNSIKDAAGRYLGVDSLREETALRQDLEAKLGQLTLALEKTKTGRGVNQGMYDRLKDYYPNKKDNAETLKLKLKSISEDAELFSEAANLSAQYGANLTIEDVKNLREMQNNPEARLGQQPSEQNEMQGNYAHMVGPNGEEYDVPQDKVELYLQNNYQLAR